MCSFPGGTALGRCRRWVDAGVGLMLVLGLLAAAARSQPCRNPPAKFHAPVPHPRRGEEEEEEEEGDPQPRGLQKGTAWP